MNPWDFDVHHRMHTADPSDIDAIRNFSVALLDLHQHVMRLGRQIYRAYYIIYHCKLKKTNQRNYNASFFSFGEVWLYSTTRANNGT